MNLEDIPDKELKEQLKKDLAVTGNAFIRIDGETKRIRRVDPSQVVMYMD